MTPLGMRGMQAENQRQMHRGKVPLATQWGEVGQQGHRGHSEVRSTKREVALHPRPHCTVSTPYCVPARIGT